MIGYAISGALYGKFMAELKCANLAHEERIRVERDCREAVKMLREFRAELENKISHYLKENISVFHASLTL